MTSSLAPQNHAFGTVPSKRKHGPTAIQEVKFEKHVYDKKKERFEKHVYGKKRKDCKTSTKTASKEMGTPNKQRHIDFQLILKKVKNAEEKTGKKVGLPCIIPSTFPENAMSLNEIESTEDDITSKWDIVCPTSCAPLSMAGIKQKALRSREKLYYCVKDRNAIAEETKGQHETRTWFDVRKPSITAFQVQEMFVKANNKPNESYFRGALLY